MAMTQSEWIEVKKILGKGRGVFARVAIPEGTVFERAPVLVVAWQPIEKSTLADYVYEWGKGTVAVALGYGSLYNHSYAPNAYYEDLHGQTKHYVARREIAAGEEITINYNADPDCKTDVGFEVR